MAGAQPIVAIDVVPADSTLAREAGASHTADSAGARALVAELTGAGADHVPEAGLSETVELAVDLTRPGGTAMLVGMTPQHERASIDVYRFVEEGKRSAGSNYGSAVPARDFPQICSLYLDGRLPLDLLVTEWISLDRLDDAFAAMRRRDGARRVIVF